MVRPIKEEEKHLGGECGRFRSSFLLPLLCVSLASGQGGENIKNFETRLMLGIINDSRICWLKLEIGAHQKGQRGKFERRLLIVARRLAIGIAELILRQIGLRK